MATEAENGRDDTQQREPREESQQSAPDASTPSGELHCPLCGGLAKSTWRDVSTLVFATFFVTLMLAPFLLLVAVAGGGPVFAILGLVSGAIALLSLWVLPVTAAIGVAARPRCRRCGHSLTLAPDDSHPPLGSPFPVWPAVVGGVTLLVILVVGLIWFRRAPGQEAGTVGLTFFLRVVMAGFALGLGFLGQTILWRDVCRRLTCGATRGLLLLLPAVVLGAAWLALTGYDHRTLSRKYDPVKRSPEVLDRAGLAALPTSARDVRVHSWAFMMSGKYTLRFTAESNDIEQFLAASPSLEGVQLRVYSSKRMLLRGGAYVGIFDRQDAHGNEYLPSEPDVPSWYQQEIRGSGRRYEISWYDGKYQGELLVDDEHHTVYIHVDRF